MHAITAGESYERHWFEGAGPEANREDWNAGVREDESHWWRGAQIESLETRRDWRNDCRKFG